MKLKEIVNGTIELEEPISFVLKELYEENLAVDLNREDLETVLCYEITTEIVEEIKALMITKPDEWDYFDVMKILGF